MFVSHFSVSESTSVLILQGLRVLHLKKDEVDFRLNRLTDPGLKSSQVLRLEKDKEIFGLHSTIVRLPWVSAERFVFGLSHFGNLAVISFRDSINEVRQRPSPKTE